MRGLFLLLILITACKKANEPQRNIVLQIQEMADLATVEYTVSKVIKAQDNKTWYKIGDRKILITSQAIIKAGVDLGQVQHGDIDADGKSISVVLPPPKIISQHMPPDKIQVQYEEVGLFRTSFNNKERDALAVQAERQIRNSIDSLGILPQAKANTALLLSNMLQQAGFEQVNISFKSKDSKTIAP